MSMKLAFITWEDSTSFHKGWTGGEDEEWTSPIMYTVGYLVKKTDKYIAVTTSVTSDGKHHDVISIPVGCIVESKIVKVNKPIESK